MATARSVGGDATFSINGQFKRLNVNMKLSPGTTIRTGPDSECYISVNGLSSAVRVEPDSELELTTMNVFGAGKLAERRTALTVNRGTILCQVKKVSPNSHYEIRSPQGVAEVRGTDFLVVVTPLPGGGSRSTFSCITGHILITAKVDGQNIAKLVAEGQQWVTDEKDVKAVPQALVNQPWWEWESPYYAPPPPSPVVILQPFDGNGEPNPSVGAKRGTGVIGGPIPIPGPGPVMGTTSPNPPTHH